MKYRRFWLLLPLSLGFSSAQAEEALPSCELSIKCENGGQPFSIEFKSASGDCTEDDMAVTFSSSRGSRKLDLKPAWYYHTDHISKTQDAICTDRGSPFAAYAVGQNSALLFVKSSGRPGYDFVNVVLLDTLAGEVMDEIHLGLTKNEYVAVLKTKEGFKTRIIRDSLSFHKDVSCDCDAPFVDDWMSVAVKQSKIVTSWVEPGE